MSDRLLVENHRTWLARDNKVHRTGEYKLLEKKYWEVDHHIYQECNRSITGLDPEDKKLFNRLVD